jgi:hypothetical protein
MVAKFHSNSKGIYIENTAVLVQLDLYMDHHMGPIG